MLCAVCSWQCLLIFVSEVSKYLSSTLLCITLQAKIGQGQKMPGAWSYRSFMCQKDGSLWIVGSKSSVGTVWKHLHLQQNLGKHMRLSTDTRAHSPCKTPQKELPFWQKITRFSQNIRVPFSTQSFPTVSSSSNCSPHSIIYVYVYIISLQAIRTGCFTGLLRRKAFHEGTRHPLVIWRVSVNVNLNIHIIYI